MPVSSQGILRTCVKGSAVITALMGIFLIFYGRSTGLDWPWSVSCAVIATSFLPLLIFYPFKSAAIRILIWVTAIFMEVAIIDMFFHCALG